MREQIKKSDKLWDQIDLWGAILAVPINIVIAVFLVPAIWRADCLTRGVAIPVLYQENGTTIVAKIFFSIMFLAIVVGIAQWSLHDNAEFREYREHMDAIRRPENIKG